MKKSRIIMPLLLLFLAIVSCQVEQSALSNITPTQTFSIENTPSKMWTRRPTLTNINTRMSSTSLSTARTSSPLPGLHTVGPYILMDNNPWVLFELDGSGRHEINRPEGYQSGYSPDMRWYAYATGQLSASNSVLPKGGVVLHIRNTWTGEIRDVANMAPEDYFTRQTRMVKEFTKELISQGADEQYINYFDISGAILGLDFWPAWSPDSRYLAFAAIIDGDSSDVYLYDVDTGSISRKDSDKLNIGHISWSPDGEWIHYFNCLPTVNAISFPYSPMRYVRADPSNVDIQMDDCLYEWLSSFEWIISKCRGSGGIPGSTDLSIFNTKSGARSVIWTGGWSFFAIDEEEGYIIINASDPCKEDSCEADTSGIYIGPIIGSKRRISDSDPENYALVFRKGKIHRFLGLDGGGYGFSSSIDGITADGQFESLTSGVQPGDVSISPDFRWLVLYGRQGITIFDEYDNVQYQWNDQPVYSLIWRTNSQGLFFSSTYDVIFLSLPSFETQSIFSCNPQKCSELSALISALNLSSLPRLRARPPSIEKQTQGASLWTKATFKDLPGPGIREYSVIIPAYSEWRWDFSWCAKSQAGLEAILEPVDIRFYIGGEQLGEDIFRIYDSSKGGRYCRTWATLLAGWQPGDSTDLVIRYTLNKEIDDGTQKYPVGEYRQIIHITVVS